MEPSGLSGPTVNPNSATVGQVVPITITGQNTHFAQGVTTVDFGPGITVSNLTISSATSAAVDSAFNALAETVLVQNARTLEDLVREMLRPMLKVWLDDNLPGLVERLVRAEIERVSRGRTG